MTSLALRSRMLFWIALVVYVVVRVTIVPEDDLVLVSLGSNKLMALDLIMLTGMFLGLGPLLRYAGGEPSGTRTASRLLIAYFLYQVLVVVPIAIWLGGTTVTAVAREVEVRFAWIVLPIVLMLASDERTRGMTGAIVLAGAVAAGLIGAYIWATGGGGFYVEEGVSRFRVITGMATLLFAFPLVVSSSGAAPRGTSILLFVVSLAGLTMTNHRSGIIGFGVAAVACVLMSGRVRRLAYWAVPASIAGGLVVLLFGDEIGRMFGYSFGRLIDFGTGTGADRMGRWQAALAYVTSKPLNDYTWSWTYYGVRFKDAFPPHNFVLETGAVEGIAGFLFYAGMLTVALRRVWHRVRTDAHARALVGYLIAFGVFSFGNANWYAPVSMLLLAATIGGLVARGDALVEQSAGAAGRIQGSSGAGRTPGLSAHDGDADVVPARKVAGA